MDTATVEPSNDIENRFTVELVPRGDARDVDVRSCWLRARGPLTARAAEVVDALLAARQEAGARYVRLDLSEVSALDDRGLGMLVRVHHRFLAARGTLVLTGVGANMHREIVAAGLDRVLLIVPPTAATRAPILLPAGWSRSLQVTAVVGEKPGRGGGLARLAGVWRDLA